MLLINMQLKFLTELFRIQITKETLKNPIEDFSVLNLHADDAVPASAEVLRRVRGQRRGGRRKRFGLRRRRAQKKNRIRSDNGRTS